MLIYYLQMIESEEDKTKFEQIYINYNRLMFYIAKDILKNEEDAWDAVHNSFLSIVDKMDRIHDTKCNETKAFLMIIVKNKAIDIYRRKNKIQFVELVENDDYYCIADPEIPEDCEYSVLSKLKPFVRDVLILKYGYEYSNDEVAQMLNSTPEAVRKAAWRARKKLKEMVEEKDE